MALTPPSDSSPSSGLPGHNEDPGSDQAKATIAVHPGIYSYMTTNEFLLGLVALLFGLMVILSGMWTLRNTTITAEQALRFYAVIVILIGTLLLILSGLDGQTVAPAMGLFGTIAGYILGKSQTTDDRAKKPVTPQVGGAEGGDEPSPEK